MNIVISVLIVIVCILLILVVLVQNSKGGGIASNFSASNQVIGVKRTTELIEKITWGLAIALFVLCMSASFLSNSVTVETKDTELRELIESTPAPQPMKNMPASPAQDENNTPPSNPDK